jgi:dTDP-4-amino-4,6-dideoxygalactose transaminase
MRFLNLRVASAGTPVSPGDLLAAALGTGPTGDFEHDLRSWLDVPWVGLCGSGTSALYAALRLLARRGKGRRVLLPAYTAPSLVLPIRKAGLTPALADVSLDTLNADASQLLDRVDEDTLAVVPVHMYGLATGVTALSSGLAGSGVVVVEDACSAMGTRIAGRHAGTLGQIGFYSFNRGKNLSTLSGGAVSSADPDLARDLQSELDLFPPQGPAERLRGLVLASGLSVAVHPLGYTLLHPVVSQFKYTELHTDFQVRGYAAFQARLGRRLLRRSSLLFQERRDHAAFLRRALEGIAGVRLPVVLDQSIPVLNQFPLLLPDSRTRDIVYRAVLGTGLEATVLYPDPIHRIYKDIWDGTGPDPFPNATAVSQRLLLIPVHPLVPVPALRRAVDAIAEALTTPTSRKAPRDRT